MTPLLDVQKLVKRFGRLTVLQQISFRLYQGESVVLAGPNGSGKSTLLRIIAGLLAQDEGEVMLLPEEGQGPGPNRGGVSIGYVPERMPLLRFTPEEYLTHMGAIQGTRKAELQKRVDELLLFCRLDHARGTKIRNFSKGMLQKVGIMQALLSRPKLLLMDEPFSGLDVASQEDLLSLLLQLRQEGMALLFVSHEPELSERLATRMLLLDPGGTCQDKPLQARNTVRMQVRASGLMEETVGELGAAEGVKLATWESGEACLFCVEEDCCDRLLLQILQRGGSVRGVWKEQEIRMEWSRRNRK